MVCLIHTQSGVERGRSLCKAKQIRRWLHFELSRPARLEKC